MRLRKVSCNGCGAPVRIAPKAKFVTCRHCEVTLEVMREGETVWTEERVEKIEGSVAELELQVALMKLDRNWEIEKEQYMIRTQHGGKRTPSMINPKPVFIAGGLAALFLLMFHWGVAIVAILITGIVGLVVSYEHGRALALHRARMRYRRRRRELMRKYRGPAAA